MGISRPRDAKLLLEASQPLCCWPDLRNWAGRFHSFCLLWLARNTQFYYLKPICHRCNLEDKCLKRKWGNKGRGILIGGLLWAYYSCSDWPKAFKWALGLGANSRWKLAILCRINKEPINNTGPEEFSDCQIPREMESTRQGLKLSLLSCQRKYRMLREIRLSNKQQLRF